MIRGATAKDSLVAVEADAEFKSLNVVADKTKSGLLRQAVFRFTILEKRVRRI